MPVPLGSQQEEIGLQCSVFNVRTLEAAGAITDGKLSLDKLIYYLYMTAETQNQKTQTNLYWFILFQLIVNCILSWKLSKG